MLQWWEVLVLSGLLDEINLLLGYIVSIKENENHAVVHLEPLLDLLFYEVFVEKLDRLVVFMVQFDVPAVPDDFFYNPRLLGAFLIATSDTSVANLSFRGSPLGIGL